ncbi:spore coat protein [Lysinibacillus sp. BW-2-10]|uniref:spore coat protein n=1 Tax=Lysinibacillus sp. BW-2-10 TaxID=2590030 RepID=UPI00117E5913|nr:spore coat protein [Lysinibacillus sp. BW-2-10]TSI11678.1 spore coat protein [Lysinibacillus sp. BW-2-10]
MSELPKSPKVISNKVIDLLVSDVLQKNGVNLEDVKKKLSDDQKELLKAVVEDLTAQVDEFVKKSPKKK